MVGALVRSRDWPRRVVLIGPSAFCNGSRGSAHHIEHFSRLRHRRDVAGVQLDGRGTHALRRCAFLSSPELDDQTTGTCPGDLHCRLDAARAGIEGRGQGVCSKRRDQSEPGIRRRKHFGRNVVSGVQRQLDAAAPLPHKMLVPSVVARPLEGAPPVMGYNKSNTSASLERFWLARTTWLPAFRSRARNRKSGGPIRL